MVPLITAPELQIDMNSRRDFQWCLPSQPHLTLLIIYYRELPVHQLNHNFHTVQQLQPNQRSQCPQDCKRKPDKTGDLFACIAGLDRSSCRSLSLVSQQQDASTAPKQEDSSPASASREQLRWARRTCRNPEWTPARPALPPSHTDMEPSAAQHTAEPAQKDSEGAAAAGAAAQDELAQAIMRRRFCPSLITTEAWEGFTFASLEIRIKESTDCYGAMLWPSALVLCHFLDTNRDLYNLNDKNVIELGAGTGLVTIVASLLGAKVTSTDLPDVLGNLQYNVNRNTRGRCKHRPRVTELTWGQDLEERFPRASCRYDYILAADVVYAHPYLNELMETFEHLCQDQTTILWAMRFRLDPENSFVGRFKQRFHVELIYDLPSLSIKLFRANRKRRSLKSSSGAAA